MPQPPSLVPSVDNDVRLSKDTDVEQPPFAEKQAEPTAPAPVSPFHPSQFPDGGKDAWLCLLGGACCLFCSFGWINCLGVFQAYYQANQLRDYSPSTIAWIPSIEIFMMFWPGPVSSIVPPSKTDSAD
jgi:hypothetical protein